MNNYKHDFLIIGGDLRLVYMGDYLSKQGFKVTSFKTIKPLKSSIISVFDYKKTLQESRFIVGPIPFSKDQITINSPHNEPTLTLNFLMDHLTPQQTLLGGCLPSKLTTHCQHEGISFIDFMAIDDIALYNSIATAEGIIAKVITDYPSNLHECNCLILGFGKCAQTLALKLNPICKNLSISARNKNQLLLANSYGIDSFNIHELSYQLEQFDLIFNTIPSLVLTRSLLNKVNSHSMILDIASAPGGIDFNVAKELDIAAKLYPGLPGIYAPKSSGEYLAQYTINNLLKTK